MKSARYLAAMIVAAGCGATPSEHASTTDFKPCVLPGATVRPSSATLHPGDTLRVTARLDMCGLGDPVGSWRWSSNDTTVAIVGAASGLIQARNGGTATIVAAAVQDPNFKGAMLLVVAP